MTDLAFGRLLEGEDAAIRLGRDAFLAQPVDLVVPHRREDAYADHDTTLAASFSVTGPGTFLGKAQRTLTFVPSDRPGWWIDRDDQPDSLPVRVSIENVWTTGSTVSNIVLRSGSPHNYLRMVEHIVALRYGMALDNVCIRVSSGDPPLFERGSRDLVEAIDRAGIITTHRPARYVTVKEKVSIVGPYGNFLTFHPAAPGSQELTIDCALDFPNAIGRQRIQYTMNNATFRKGAVARTNTNIWVMLYCKTVGKIFADVRNLGYSSKNLLIAGPRSYFNEPQLMHEGKSLEAVWHRSALDLLAAIALIDTGRFVGHVESYKAGHALDCKFITKLIQHDLLEPVPGG
ncbi:MAG: UDP-3-O-acyl-N-acetylglucosamine deacetylase [Verrucomicrobia bacterium]|nr:UDP-3-O-acyl-N-acetylglucosamine deacetylase [Verrucomicrobiota bacterium]